MQYGKEGIINTEGEKRKISGTAEGRVEKEVNI